MALALVGLDLVGPRDRLVDVLHPVERHGDGQFLAGEGEVRPGAGFGDDEESGALGDVETGHAGDRLGRLGDDLGIERAVDPEHVLELRLLRLVEDEAALRLQPGEHLVVDRVDQKDAVVGRAGGGHVERLRHADLLGGVVEVGGLVDGDHRIADADAQRRRAARISGVDHRPAAGGEDAVALLHQLVGLVERRRVDADDEVGRRAHGDQRLAHLVADELVGELGARVRGDDDRVPALDRVDRLDHRRRLGVGGRRQRADHADRLGDDDDLALGIFLEHADRLVAQYVHQGGAGLAEDLEIFALVIAEPGLVDGEAGDLLGDAGARDRPDHGADQRVDLLLAVMLDLLLRRARPRDQAGDLGGGLGRFVAGEDSFLLAHLELPAPCLRHM